VQHPNNCIYQITKKLKIMATGTPLIYKNAKSWVPTEILPLLKEAKKAYRIDAASMADGGMCLTSSFISYCEIDKMQQLMDESGQTYKGTAENYAASYNRLFEIDF
jgi:hypothetical protein